MVAILAVILCQMLLQQIYLGALCPRCLRVGLGYCFPTLRFLTPAREHSACRGPRFAKDGAPTDGGCLRLLLSCFARPRTFRCEYDDLAQDDKLSWLG